MAEIPGLGGAQKPPTEPVDEFELLRRRAKRRGAASAAGQQRDLNRQFAALGNLPSGAALKVRQQAATAAGQQTSDDLAGINVLQAQTQRAERESQAQRDLQRFGIQQQAQTAQRGQSQKLP